MTEVTSKDSKVKLNQATTCLLGRLTKFTIYFLQLILNVRVNNRELWQFMFREVYTTITIHRTVFQYITTHGHQKWSITASRKYPCPSPPPLPLPSPSPLRCTCTRTRTTKSIGWKTDGGRHKPICGNYESVFLRIAWLYLESNILKETFLFVFCETVYLWMWTGWSVGQFPMAQLLHSFGYVLIET